MYKVYNVKKYCVEGDFEVVALNLINSCCIACIYISHSGAFEIITLNLCPFLSELYDRFQQLIVIVILI